VGTEGPCVRELSFRFKASRPPGEGGSEGRVVVGGTEAATGVYDVATGDCWLREWMPRRVSLDHLGSVALLCPASIFPRVLRWFTVLEIDLLYHCILCELVLLSAGWQLGR
jgi:hypothetical protein